MQVLPAFNLDHDEFAVIHHCLADVRHPAERHAAMIRILRPVHPRQPGKGDVLANQKAIHLVRVAFAQQVGRGNHFGQRVDALEVLAMVGHHLAGAPEIIQSQGAVLAAAVALRPGARRHLEVAVANGTALAQDDPHFLDGLGVLQAHLADP